MSREVFTTNISRGYTRSLMRIFKFSAIVWKVLEKNVMEFFFKAVCHVVLATLWVVARQSKLRNCLLEE